MSIDETKVDAEIDIKIQAIAELARCLKYILETYASGGKQAFKELPSEIKRFYAAMEAVIADVEKYKVK